MSWFSFIRKIKPDGKAFRSLLNTKILFEVWADALQSVMDYATFSVNDQVWYVNTNFDPELWEARYGIVPPALSTLEQRRQVVKSYMLYPQSANRLSRDYLQQELDNAGYGAAIITYNPTGLDDGFLHVNDFGNEKITFNLGALTYNTFVVSGEVSSLVYKDIIKILMSLKPLQVGFYDQLVVYSAVAYDSTLTLAIDDTNTLAITTL